MLQLLDDELLDMRIKKSIAIKFITNRYYIERYGKMEKIISKKNPIIPGKGVCDPHIHVFNDRAYLYATHDYSPANDNYIMKDWEIWSSPDLVEWTKESVIKPEDTYIGSSNSCWATDAAEKNGKYYFYFS